MEPLISSVLSYDVILLFMCLYLAYKGCLQLSHLTSMLSKSSQSFQIATKSGIVTEPYYVQRQKLEPWAKKKTGSPPPSPQPCRDEGLRCSSGNLWDESEMTTGKS